MKTETIVIFAECFVCRTHTDQELMLNPLASQIPIACKKCQTARWATDAERKKARALFVDQQITALIEEYFQLVSPTENEISESAEFLNDDRREAVDILTDPDCIFGKYYLASEAWEMRDQEMRG